MNVSQPDSRSFEEALEELEKIIRILEDGQTGLEEALNQYEKGVELLKTCYHQLNQAEKRILQLVEVDDEGHPVLKPFEHTPTAQAKPKKGTGKPLTPRKNEEGGSQENENSNDQGALPF